MTSTRTRTRAAALAAGIALATAACGGDDPVESATGAASSAAGAVQSAVPTASSMPSDMASMAPSMAPSSSAGSSAGTAGSTEPFGPGCAAVPKTGAGSFSGMSSAPVATAASANPALSTLVAAVKQAGLVDTLNGLEAATVFAPSNDAFKKVPAADLKNLLADKAALTKVLTYHVVPGKTAPDALTTAPLTSVQKGAIEVTGSGEAYTVNGNAKVVCGNVQTSNATVYIIDTVLSPPAA